VDCEGEKDIPGHNLIVIRGGWVRRGTGGRNSRGDDLTSYIYKMFDIRPVEATGYARGHSDSVAR
jgi:hypothetical protein